MQKQSVKSLFVSLCISTAAGHVMADCSTVVIGGDPSGAYTQAVAFSAVNANPPQALFALSDATKKGIALPTGAGPGYIVGTPYNDFIYAPDGTLAAGLNGGYDVLLAADPALANPGKGKVVVLQGGKEDNKGKKGDLFILGDSSKRYFAGKSAVLDADQDIAYIDQFDPSYSKIRLKGSANDYRLRWITGLTSFAWVGTAIVTKDTCDVIGFVRNELLSDPASSAFEYASNASATTAVSTASQSMTGVDQFGSPGATGWPGPVTATDSAGNTYMALSSSAASLNGVGGTGSYYLVKYDANGTRLWTKKHGTNPGTTSSTGIQAPMSIVTYGSSVYVAGLNWGPYGGAKPAKMITNGDGIVAFVAKFNSSGGLVKVAQKKPTTGTKVNPSWALTTDNKGDLFFGGSFMEGINLPMASAYVMKIKGDDTLATDTSFGTAGAVTFRNGLPITYTSFNNLIAQTTNNLQITNFTAGLKFVADGSGVPGQGSIYAAGVSDNGSFFGSQPGWNDIWYTKLDAKTGTKRWTGNYVCDFQNRCGNTGGYSLSANGADSFLWGIDVDSSGNLYLGGETGSAITTTGHSESLVSAKGTQLGQCDGLVVKIDPQGTVLWLKHVGSSASDKVRNLLVDGTSVYVSGDTWGSLTGSNKGQTDIFVRKLSSSDGSTLKTLQLGSERIDAPTALSLTSSKLYIGGFGEGSVAKAKPANGSVEAFLTSVTKSTF